MDSWRVTLLGDGGVGKTALAVLIYNPTNELEDDYRKQFVVDNRMCLVEIIDTAGISVIISEVEEYNALRDSLVNAGDRGGFMLVYSISSRMSFDCVESLYQSIRQVSRRSPVFMLVGNKCDKSYEREVSKEEGAALARRLGCDFIETSAKTAQNVERLFMNIVRSLRQVPAAAQPAKKVIKSKCVIM